jgi:uncharacterized protein involved in exopolysaccharide biosynthesis
VKRGERQNILRPERQILSDWEQELGSEMQIMKSAPVMRRARELMDAEARKIHQPMQLDPASIDVEVMGKSNVIAIGYRDLDASVAQVACRSVMEAYLEYRKNRMTLEAPRQFLNQEIAQLESQIRVKLEERRAHTEQTGMASPQIQTNSWVSQAQALEQRRSELTADLAAEQTVDEAMRQLQADPEIDLPTVSSGSGFTNEQALVTLKGKIVEQQAKIAVLTETLRDDAPEVVGARQTLETLHGLLRKEVDVRVRLSGSRIRQLQSRLAVIDKDIAAVRQELQTAPQSLKRMDEIDSELHSLRLRLREVLDARDQALITANTMPDISVIVLSPAGAAVPTNQLDFVRLALAPAFSLLVGIAIAFFVDGLDLTVRTANQAEEYLDLPVLASMSERRRRNG